MLVYVYKIIAYFVVCSGLQ